MLERGSVQPILFIQSIKEAALHTIDLHMHSKYSNDGEFEPHTLIDLCSKVPLDLVSLTDHNSAKGDVEAAKRAKELNMLFIPGIEINCQTKKRTEIHMLGYGIDPTDSAFEKIEKEVIEREYEADLLRIRIFRKLGVILDEEKIQKETEKQPLTYRVIAEVALSEYRNRDHPLLQPYLPGGNRSDNPLVNFFWDLCTTGKPADVPVDYLPVPKAIQLIRESGGIAVFAHPGASIGKNDAELAEIVEAGISGIEVYSSYHDREMTRFYEIQAQKYGLRVSVGSDFHGSLKPAIQLGSVSCNGREEEIYSFMQESISSSPA